MSGRSKRRRSEPDLASLEESVFAVLFGFPTKAMALIRKSSLDDDQLRVVEDWFKILLDDISAEATK
jgi:hypothetical protein